MAWKDVLAKGASRTPVAAGTPGSFPDWDLLNQRAMGRMDYVVGPGGVEYISGSGPDPNTVSHEEWLRGISGRNNPLVGQGWGGTGPGPSEIARKAAMDARVNSLKQALAQKATIQPRSVQPEAAFTPELLSILGVRFPDDPLEEERRRLQELGYGVSFQGPY